MLVGDDDKWLKLADQVRKKKPLQARAIQALVARTGRGKAREQALTLLVDDLVDQELDRVVLALFSVKQFTDVSKLPAATRHQLAEYALERRLIVMAGNMIDGLEEQAVLADAGQGKAIKSKGKKKPGPGKELKPGDEDVVWPLRKARILVYAGRHDAAIGELHRFVAESGKKMPAVLAERTVNVLFDLQAVEKHAEVISLLGELQPMISDKQIQRELFYWMADSYKALGELAQAAELYLRSAYHNQPGGGDIWGQTARFYAAETLAKAGMIDDARFVYTRLLRGTDDARRRSMLEQRIQQLWLYQKTQNNSPLLFEPQ